LVALHSADKRYGKPKIDLHQSRRELAGYGVDKAAATAGYSAIGDGLQRGSELAAIYKESIHTPKQLQSQKYSNFQDNKKRVSNAKRLPDLRRPPLVVRPE
jgi:hypothetical protein